MGVEQYRDEQDKIKMSTFSVVVSSLIFSFLQPFQGDPHIFLPVCICTRKYFWEAEKPKPKQTFLNLVQFLKN